MENNISAVIIDTSAYIKCQCDFAGINKSLIPMFLHLLKANDIKLLRHPILDYEIRKHTKNSELIRRVTELQNQLKRCNGQLSLINISSDELISKMDNLKIEERLLKSFSELQENAIILPYVNAKDVFEDYFRAKLPFAETGKKKNEFPDAFVLKGLLEYCNNMSTKVLVVSDDSDWKQTLSGHKNIVLADTIEAAMQCLWCQLDDKTEFFKVITTKAQNDILSEIASVASHEAFDLAGIDTADEVDITEIVAVCISENIIPLEITEDTALLQISASLSVDGSSDYLDESRSMWDREDQDYYFIAYTHLDFKNATAEVECEIRIQYPSNGGLEPISILNTKLINCNDISLDLTNAETSEKDITDYGEDDYKAEQDETFEEYHKH